MKKESMISEMTAAGARALIAGCACIIRSKLTPEEIEKFSIYHPEALKMADEDGNVIFTLDVDEGPGCMTREGAVFSRATTSDGKATITILIDPECEDRKGKVLEAVGPGFSLLDELEEHLLAMLPELEKEAEKAWDFIDQL